MDLDDAVGGRVPDGVHDQVGDDPRDPGRVGGDRDALLDTAPEPDPALPGQRADRTVALLVGAAAASVVLADLSLMSKAEAERIWLPFVPWLLVWVALLPERWRRVGLSVQVVVALAVQHLLFTTW